MRIIWRLFGLLKKYWFWTLVSMLLLVATTLMQLAVPDFLKRAIDTGVTAGNRGILVGMGLAIIGVSSLRGLLAFGQTYLSEYIGQKTAYDLRNRLYDRVQRLSFAFHDTAQTGQLMSRATQDVEAVRVFVAMGAVRSIYLLLTLFSIAGLLFFMNWQLALVTLAILPPVAFLALRMGIRQRPIWLRVQQEMGLMNIVMQEAFSGMRVVKAFNRQHSETVKFENEAYKLYTDTLVAARLQAFNGPLMGLFFSLSAAAIIYVGGHQIAAGSLTTGELAQFMLYSGMLAMPIRMLGFMVNIVSRGISAGERIFEVLDTESAVKEKPGAATLENIKGNVRFEKVSFKYTTMGKADKSRYVLRDVTLDAKPGQMIALLGATGSGKTTLVNLIPRFYDVTDGKITMDDIDIRDVTLSSLRRNIGIVQQDVFLFSATVRENIAYGAVNATEEQIIAASKTAQLHDFITNMPDGYDTWVGERGVTLSGGQRQRLAIARTLLLDPRVLILDDSTSSVDTETEFLLQKALRALMKGRTTFVIAQRLQTVKDANQILVLDKGLIVERGAHQQLLQESKIYREIYELQLRAQEEAVNRGAMI